MYSHFLLYPVGLIVYGLNFRIGIFVIWGELYTLRDLRCAEIIYKYHVFFINFSST